MIRENVKLVYAGRRDSGKVKPDYAYWDIAQKTMLYFKSKKVFVIGNMLTCNEIEPNLYNNFKHSKEIYENTQDIYDWVTEERVYLQQKETEAALKAKHNDYIDNFIKKVKSHTSTYRQQKAIALYVYTQLIK